MSHSFGGVHFVNGDVIKIPGLLDGPPSVSFISQSATAGRTYSLQIEVWPAHIEIDLMRRAPYLHQLQIVSGAQITLVSINEKGNGIFQCLLPMHSSREVVDKPLMWQFKWLSNETYQISRHISILSPPFILRQKELGGFPMIVNSQETFLVNNVGVVRCRLPQSKPHPPDVEFFHNDKLLQCKENKNRYRLIYERGVGEDGPGEMILLIRELQRSDSGYYQCYAVLGEKSERAIQKTHVEVKEPRKTTRGELKYSRSNVYQSDSNGQELTHSETIIRVREGENITLFCALQSAPVDQIIWYAQHVKRSLQYDQQFGTLTLQGVTKDDAILYSCILASLNQISRSFRVEVLSPLKTIVSPVTQMVSTWNTKIYFHCAPDQHLYGSLTDIAEYHREAIYLWYHNRQLVMKGPKLSIVVNEMSQLGVYQCGILLPNKDWAMGEGFLLLSGDQIIFHHNASVTVPHGPNRRWKGGASPIVVTTKEGITGHLTCNISQKLSRIRDPRFASTIEVRWYHEDQLIDLHDVATSKYIESNFEAFTPILSIVNPQSASKLNRLAQPSDGGRNQFSASRVPGQKMEEETKKRFAGDEGVYSCRVFDRSSRTELMRQEFILLIDNGKAGALDTGNYKPFDGVTESANRPEGNKAEERPESNEKTQGEKSFSHFKIHATAYIGYRLLVTLRWNTTKTGQRISFDYYRVELQHRQEISQTWSAPILLPNVIEKEEFSMLSADEESKDPINFQYPLQTGHMYRFRVLAFLKSNTAKQSFKSEWSEPPIKDFLSVLPVRVDLVSVNAFEGGITVSWKYGGDADVAEELFQWDGFVIHCEKIPELSLNNATSIKDHHSGATTQGVRERLLWPRPTASPFGNISSAAKSKGDQAVEIYVTGRDIRSVNVTEGIEPNTLYKISVYGKQVNKRDTSQFARRSLQSLELTVRTPFTLKTSWHSENGQIGNATPERSQRLTPESETTNYVILGCLIGVLIVLLMVFMLLCTIRMMHLRRRRRRLMRGPHGSGSGASLRNHSTGYGDHDNHLPCLVEGSLSTPLKAALAAGTIHPYPYPIYIAGSNHFSYPVSSYNPALMYSPGSLVRAPTPMNQSQMYYTANIDGDLVSMTTAPPPHISRNQLHSSTGATLPFPASLAADTSREYLSYVGTAGTHEDVSRITKMPSSLTNCQNGGGDFSHILPSSRSYLASDQASSIYSHVGDVGTLNLFDTVNMERQDSSPDMLIENQADDEAVMSQEPKYTSKFLHLQLPPPPSRLTPHSVVLSPNAPLQQNMCHFNPVSHGATIDDLIPSSSINPGGNSGSTSTDYGGAMDCSIATGVGDSGVDMRWPDANQNSADPKITFAPPHTSWFHQSKPSVSIAVTNSQHNASLGRPKRRAKRKVSSLHSRSNDGTADPSKCSMK